MNSTTYNLQQDRRLLADALEVYNGLLDELEAESANLEGWAKTKFEQRFAVLDKLVNIIVQYDNSVQQYIRFHPDGQNVQYYKDKLDIARRYIIANGLDWSTVTWGKKSDYTF